MEDDLKKKKKMEDDLKKMKTKVQVTWIMQVVRSSSIFFEVVIQVFSKKNLGRLNFFG